MIIDGKKIRQTVIDELKGCVDSLEDKPNFTVIQVGDNEASNVYINQKRKMAEEIGYGFNHIRLDDTAETTQVVDLIDRLNSDSSIHGIMVQMPLPSHMDTSVIQNAILPVKDIDGLCFNNNGKLMLGGDGLYSCTPSGIMELLSHYNIDLEGKHAVIVGRSNLVGKPMAMMLINAGATVTVCNSKTVEIEKYTKMADILVVAVGKPGLITKEMVKDGAVIVDVGITRLADGLRGDVMYDEVSQVASYITPVPGGVGPMTVAMLARNVYKAYLLQKNS